MHYGVEALRDYYTKECPEYVRRDREDWAYEVTIMLRNRFMFTEFYEEYFTHAISRENWIKWYWTLRLWLSLALFIFSINS